MVTMKGDTNGIGVGDNGVVSAGGGGGGGSVSFNGVVVAGGSGGGGGNGNLDPKTNLTNLHHSQQALESHTNGDTNGDAQWKMLLPPDSSKMNKIRDIVENSA
ncbi:hypothetical protein SK128_020062, partial [Halocaridina rubra]